MPINEQLSFSVSFGGNVKASATATINDTSRPAYEYMLVGSNPSTTEITEIDIPTYTLASNKTSVNEGETITFTLSTTMLDTGTVVPWTVTGISAADLSSGSMTGAFVTDSAGKATTTFVLTNDSLTEGIETLTITLNGKGISKSVTINDTSVLVPTYNVDNAFIFTVGQWYDSANNGYVRGYRAANGTGAIVENNLYIGGIKFNPDQAYGSYLDPITGSINYVAYILTGTPGINFSDDYRFKLTNLNNGNTYYSGNGSDVVVVNNQTLLAANSPEHRDIILANLLIVGNNVKLEIERL